jgi:uncharacterized PurR-regulated membrane protein YhhQ (DUF165 family)
MKRCGIPAFLAFIATIPAANYLIQHVGTTCVPDGPCLVPVLPGLMAPSGVLVVGLALVLRDMVHSALGVRWAFFAIVAGAALSSLLAPPALVLASVVAFLLSETADLLVYAPLRERWPSSAVLASGVAGAVVDSCLFLFIAFGSLQYVTGQVVGKLWMSVAAALLLRLLTTRREPVGV